MQYVSNVELRPRHNLKICYWRVEITIDFDYHRVNR